MRPLTVLLTTLVAFPALADDDAACPLAPVAVEKSSGLKFVKREVVPWTFGQMQCKYVMESGWVAFTRVLPEAHSVKTEAEVAAKLAETEKRRVLKDFSVPAYSFSGGVTVVLPRRGIWQVLVMHGEKRGLNPMELGKVLVETHK